MGRAEGYSCIYPPPPGPRPGPRILTKLQIKVNFDPPQMIFWDPPT
jgi:hypothetical protein